LIWRDVAFCKIIDGFLTSAWPVFLYVAVGMIYRGAWDIMKLRQHDMTLEWRTIAFQDRKRDWATCTNRGDCGGMLTHPPASQSRNDKIKTISALAH
jgi:hypothetical protein